MKKSAAKSFEKSEGILWAGVLLLVGTLNLAWPAYDQVLLTIMKAFYFSHPVASPLPAWGWF